MAFTLPLGDERGRLFADLRSEALDVDALPDLSASADLLGDIDLSLALDAAKLHVARVGEAAVDGGSLSLKVTKTGDDFSLDRLSVAGLGGAAVEARGASGPRGRWLSARLDAAKLRRFRRSGRTHRSGPFEPAAHPARRRAVAGQGDARSAGDRRRRRPRPPARLGQGAGFGRPKPIHAQRAAFRRGGSGRRRDLRARRAGRRGAVAATRRQDGVARERTARGSRLRRTDNGTAASTRGSPRRSRARISTGAGASSRTR